MEKHPGGWVVSAPNFGSPGPGFKSCRRLNSAHDCMSLHHSLSSFLNLNKCWKGCKTQNHYSACMERVKIGKKSAVLRKPKASTQTLVQTCSLLFQADLSFHILDKKDTEFYCVLLAPAYNTHQVFAQDFVGKKMFLCLFRALLTKFWVAKACHISLRLSWKWPNLAGHESKQAEFTTVLTKFLIFMFYWITSLFPILHYGKSVAQADLFKLWHVKWVLSHGLVINAVSDAYVCFP